MSDAPLNPRDALRYPARRRTLQDAQFDRLRDREAARPQRRLQGSLLSQ